MTEHGTRTTEHGTRTTENGTRVTEHEITVAAPGAAVYELIETVGHWPRIFPPTIYAERAELAGSSERIRLWATANGAVKSWTSRRTLDPDALRVSFRQEVSAPPVAAMGGTWIIEPRPDDGCLVRLLHDFRAVGDDPESLAWISTAVDTNSRSELAALKAAAELDHASGDLTLSFEDAIPVSGTAADVYDFIRDAARWPDRLPHVAAVRLDEPAPGVQSLEMETLAKDGSTHTTMSHRVCFPHDKIVYKQLTLPPLLAVHTGCWTFRAEGRGCTANSQHTVTIRAGKIREILGETATPADARAYVRDVLGTNSRATLGHARQYAESRS